MRPGIHYGAQTIVQHMGHGDSIRPTRLYHASKIFQATHTATGNYWNINLLCYCLNKLQVKALCGTFLIYRCQEYLASTQCFTLFHPLDHIQTAVFPPVVQIGLPAVALLLGLN